MKASSHPHRDSTHPAVRPAVVGLGVAASLILLTASVTLAAPPARVVNVLLDVRAEWGRTLSECVTEGVFFGFHTGTSRYIDGSAVVTIDEDTAGVWWWQTDVCEPSNSFFHTGDVHMAPSEFFIDRQLESAWVDIEIPVSDGTSTYLFSFDLAYTALGAPSVGVVHDGPDAIRRDRAVPVDVTGVAASSIPGGFSGLHLAWADMGSLTDNATVEQGSQDALSIRAHTRIG